MRRALVAGAVAALGAAAYLVLDPPSADLAAQEYRVGLFERAGPALWNNGWYAGHHTPAYSVLFPPLGAAIGARLAGALAAVVAAVLFARIAEKRWGAPGRWGALWFAVGIAAHLATGRLAFTLGVAAGLAAVLALQSGRRPLAAALGVVTALSSPVAALFVALGAAAWGVSARGEEPGDGEEEAGGEDASAGEASAGRGAARSRRLWGAAVGTASLGSALALAALFPEGGTEPFVASAFWPALGAIAVVAVVLPARERALRAGAVLYALGTALTFALATPLGGNVTRMGALVAGPLVLAALAGRRRPAVLAALVVPLAYWQLYPPVRDVARAWDDPTVEAAYHAPLVQWLQSRPGTFRVEIAFTENHWEAAHVAPHVALARGWERQVDRKYGEIFYEGDLDAAEYRAWLGEHAVRYVAIPDAELDYAARAEARLVGRGLPYLRPVWRGEHWLVYEVRDAQPLVEGAADGILLSEDGFAVDAHRAGDALVRVRHSRWWRVTAGAACVEEGPGGMTRVRVRRPGTVRVQARLTGSRCAG